MRSKDAVIDAAAIALVMLGAAAFALLLLLMCLSAANLEARCATHTEAWRYVLTGEAPACLKPQTPNQR